MRKFTWNKTVMTFLILGALPLYAETHQEGKTSEASRTSNGFAEYDTLSTKFDGWAKKAGDAKSEKSFESDKFKATLSESELEELSKNLKRIKWYREKISSCESSDSSSSLLGETFDSCLAPGLLSKSVQDATKKNDLWEMTLPAKDWALCKVKIADYFKAKSDANKANKVDNEIADKTAKLFDTLMAGKSDFKAEGSTSELVDALKKVDSTNWCMVEDKKVTAEVEAVEQPAAEKVKQALQQPGKVEQAAVAQPQPYGAAQPYQAPANGYQAPADGYQAPAGGYQAPAGGYRPPIGGYQPPEGGYGGAGMLPYLMGQNYNPGNQPNYTPQAFAPRYPPERVRHNDPIPPPLPPVAQPVQQSYPPMFFPPIPPAPIPPIIGAGVSVGYSSGGCCSTPIPYTPPPPLYPSVLGSTCTTGMCPKVSCTSGVCQNMPLSPYGMNPMSQCLTPGVGINPLGTANPACTTISTQFYMQKPGMPMPMPLPGQYPYPTPYRPGYPQASYPGSYPMQYTTQTSSVPVFPQRSTVGRGPAVLPRLRSLIAK